MIRLALLFGLSGLAGLVYEVVFAKSLAVTFGSSAAASTTVLAIYMGGMALGALAGGRLGARVPPLRAYAICELAIGIFCALSPAIIAGVRTLYVVAARGSDPGAPSLLLLRVLLGGLTLLVPTMLMGATLPFLVRAISADARGLGRAVSLLYGANTLGAALGAVASGYFILPALGVRNTTLLAVALNFAAALGALRLRLPSGPLPDAPPATEAGDRRLRRLSLVVLGVGGLVTFVLETTYIHLLAVVAGNSAYAFSLMLFAFLLGLGGGAAIARRWRASIALGLGLGEIALAACVLAGVYAWDDLPRWFVAVADWPLAKSFAGRELVRFVVSGLLLLPPAICIGFLYPTAMAGVGRTGGEGAREAGRAAALNTIGNVAGALIGGFVILPRLGSLRALQLAAFTALALALLVLVVLRGRERVVIAGGVALGLALLGAQPRAFDLSRLASGANVYFMADRLGGTVIDSAESQDGGLTTVIASTRRSGEPQLTLRTNGKFQGDDGPEVAAQLGFALDALLHVERRERALVIGFGTGTTTHALVRAGFRRVEVAELAADILALAHRHFRAVNGGVLDRPEVRAHVADGRNYLLLADARYDLIGLEITSIWFAGAAALYNREFYQLARAHLEPRGVLQQWVQLHHITLADVISILATVRAEFPSVWLYHTGGQGVIIACAGECAPRPETLARLDDAAIAPLVTRVGGIPRLLAGQLLDPAGVDRLLESIPDAASLISNDDNLRLEYSTPRGNLLGFSYQPILDALAPFSTPR